MKSARRITRLLFVYDAPSGKLAAIADSLKKVVGRGCPLCAVTHGLFGKRATWAQAERRLGVPVDYLHNDELGLLRVEHPVDLPCILAELEGGGSQIVLLDPEAIDRARGTETDLRGRLAYRAASLGLELPYAE
jgi:hypothetical protein